MALLSGPAALFTAWPVLSWQADAVADAAKIVALVSLSTAALSAVLWTGVMALSPARARPVLAGALIGAVTAALIVPLPFFGWALKERVPPLLSGQASGVGDWARSVAFAAQHGLSAFIQFTKASIGAVVLSTALGAWLARPLAAR